MKSRPYRQEEAGLNAVADFVFQYFLPVRSDGGSGVFPAGDGRLKTKRSPKVSVPTAQRVYPPGPAPSSYRRSNLKKKRPLQDREFGNPLKSKLYFF